MNRIKIDNSDLQDDAQGMWTQAELFRDASYALNKRIEEFTDTDVQFKLTIPVSTNMAFATELYLKCLHFLDHGVRYKKPGADGHNLLMIFQALKTTTQKEITAYQEEIVQKNNLMHTTPPHLKLDIISILTNCQSAFVRLRYFYEPFQKTNAGIDTVMNAARVVVYERQQTWILWEFDEVVVVNVHPQVAKSEDNPPDATAS